MTGAAGRGVALGTAFGLGNFAFAEKALLAAGNGRGYAAPDAVPGRHSAFFKNGTSAAFFMRPLGVRHHADPPTRVSGKH